MSCTRAANNAWSAVIERQLNVQSTTRGERRTLTHRTRENEHQGTRIKWKHKIDRTENGQRWIVSMSSKAR